ncbi:hypothetical protein Taro_002173 [Colocasia esculenta]|uniref:Uncharacterized protein n=1 Tax=Colocasia esculenta TaxID=4460 RepID=A0A843TD71_COLES|nr:hypothetical protein [Colocasia esculenta]
MSRVCPRRGGSRRRCQQRSQWHSLREQRQQQQAGSSSESTSPRHSSMQIGSLWWSSSSGTHTREHGSLGRRQWVVNLQYLPQQYRSSRQIRRWSSQQFSSRRFRKLSTRGGGQSRQQRRQSRFVEQSVQQGAEQGRQEQQQLQQAPQRGRGRVMALTKEQAEASNLVIGTFPMLGRAAHVLVDPDASLCFASKEFYESLVHHTLERQCDVMVDLPSAVVDCQRKSVRFEIPGAPVLCFRVVSGRIVSEPPSAEDATAIEVAMMSRPGWPPRHHRDALGCDKVVTAWAATIVSQQGWASRQGETSQQRQGGRRAEEMGW